MKQNNLIQKIKKISFFFIFLFVFNQVFTQVIFSNAITGVRPNASNPYTVGQTVASGITVSGIGRGAGITDVNADDCYSAKGWTSNSTPDLTDYFQWTITPNTCSKVNFQNLSIELLIGNINAPSRFQLRSSIDNYANSIKTDSFTVVSTYTLQYDLSAFNNITQPITFRLYGYRAFNISGDVSINNFTFNGSINPTVVANAGPDQTICLGNNAVLSATGGDTFSWSTGQNTSSITVAPSNTHTYTVTATVGACSATDQVVITTTTPSIPYSLGTRIYYVWSGLVSTEFNDNGNWYKYDGTGYSISNDYPNASVDVIIPSGSCVNNPIAIKSNVQVDSLIILNGATLSFSGQGPLIANNDVIIKDGALIDMGLSSAIFEIKDGNLKMLGNAAFKPGNGTLKFHTSIGHPEGHTLICESSSNNTFFNLDFHGDNDPSIHDFLLGNNINVTGELKVSTNSFKLNGYHVDLGSTGTISEGNNNKKIYDLGNGYISAERSILADGTAFNLGNLGLTIKAAAGKPLGTTLIKRYHTSISYDLDGLYNAAVSRYYSVTPQFNGGTTYTDGLGATVTFNYSTATLTSDDIANEVNFAMYRKGQGESSWQKLDGGVLNMSNKTYTYTNFPKFSDVTLGGGGTPLPVDLLSFSGNCQENQVTLKWKTASEHNSAYFDVEKSRDGVRWEVLKTVQAAGNSNQTLTYNAMDVSAGNDNNYYRLKQVDIDGTQKQYNVINVGCHTQEKGHIISYPNPSGSSFQIAVNDEDLVGRCVLNIYDSKGIALMQRELNIEEGINLFSINEQFAPGIYFISITNGNKSTDIIRHSVK